MARGETDMRRRLEWISAPHGDLAVLHLGGTRVLLHTVTMDARQGVDAVRRLSPSRVVPVHFDDYRVFRDPLENFLHRAGVAGFASRLVRVDRGDTVDLDRP